MGIIFAIVLLCESPKASWHAFAVQISRSDVCAKKFPEWGSAWGVCPTNYRQGVILQGSVVSRVGIRSSCSRMTSVEGIGRWGLYSGEVAERRVRFSG